MKKKTLVVVIAIISISSVATATFFLTQGDNPLIYITEPGKPTFDYLKGATIIPYQELTPVYNEITGDYRPEYPLTPEQYGYIFGNLPSFPEDFWGIASLVYEGKVTDYVRLSENYWKQPEFFSGWYDAFDNFYLNNDPLMWTPEGYGMFPIIKEISAPSGSTILVDGFLRTGFGIEAYQGVIFRPHLPPTAKALTGEPIFDQPENANQYLKVRITNPDNPIYESFKEDIQYNNVNDEDWFVILEPTYQRAKNAEGEEIELGFPEDWIRTFQIEVEIKSDTPKGMYVVSIVSDTPCFEINQEFYLSHEHEYYGKQYYPAGRMQKSIVPHFQVIIEVI